MTAIVTKPMTRIPPTTAPAIIPAGDPSGELMGDIASVVAQKNMSVNTQQLEEEVKDTERVHRPNVFANFKIHG